MFLDEEVGDYDSSNWDFISLGDQKQLGIKTDGLEDKLTACEMLVSFARELGPAFGKSIVNETTRPTWNFFGTPMGCCLVYVLTCPLLWYNLIPSNRTFLSTTPTTSFVNYTEFELSNLSLQPNF